MSGVSDFVVVGAGVVGVTVAHELRRRHGGTVLVIDKESGPGLHASGRNSGVLHAGVYYQAGTLKARLCVEGNRRMREYCAARHLPMNTAGKVIVARGTEELNVLDELHRRATANGVRVAWLDEQALPEVEPCARTVKRALYVKDTAVVDPLTVLQNFVMDAKGDGVEFQFGCEWRGLAKGKTIETSQGRIAYGHVVNCAGLFADRVAQAFGIGQEYQMLPFRGGYYQLSAQSLIKVRGNIYPVPDLRNPFLGVHFTTKPNHDVTVGPTALPLAGREQYSGVRGMRLSDSICMVRYLAKLFRHNADHFRALALRELVKMTRAGFYREAKDLVRGLNPRDLLPGKRAGIRAQLLNTHTAELVNDFLLAPGPHSTHMLNAVSPAFTCSLPLAEHVVSAMKPGE